MASIPGGLADLPDTGAPTSEWVVFRCGPHRYALPVERIREITRPLAATRLPGCGAEVRGVIARRGRIVTVFDLCAVLGEPGGGRAADARLLLVERGGRIVGLEVAGVLGVARGAAAELEVGADELRWLDVERPEVAGVGTFEGEAFVALRPDRLLDRLLA